MLKEAISQIPVTSDNCATFICPECEWSKTLDVSRYLQVEKEIRLKIHCRCGHTCFVILDRRKCLRKKTDLYGNFMRVHLPGSFYQKRTGLYGEMVVTNLSKGGLQFKPFLRPFLEPEDLVLVEFHLDDLNRSRIRKQAKVKSVIGMDVGVEYIASDSADFSDRAISYYLYFGKE